MWITSDPLGTKRHFFLSTSYLFYRDFDIFTRLFTPANIFSTFFVLCYMHHVICDCKWVTNGPEACRVIVQIVAVAFIFTKLQIAVLFSNPTKGRLFKNDLPLQVHFHLAPVMVSAPIMAVSYKLNDNRLVQLHKPQVVYCLSISISYTLSLKCKRIL